VAFIVLCQKRGKTSNLSSASVTSRAAFRNWKVDHDSRKPASLQ